MGGPEFLLSQRMFQLTLQRSVQWVFTLLALNIPCLAPAANRVWFESPLAQVTSGFDATSRQYADRRLYVVVVGPEDVRDLEPSEIGYCARVAGEGFSKGVRDSVLQALPQTAGAAIALAEAPPAGVAASAPTPADLAASGVGVAEVASVPLTRLDAAFAAHTADLRRRLAVCGGKRFPAASFRLGIVQRYCDSSSCDTAKPAFAGSYSATSYSLVGDWLSQRLDRELAPQGDEVVVLPDRASPSIRAHVLGAPVDAVVQAKCSAIPRQTTKAWDCQVSTGYVIISEKAANSWPVPPTGKEAQEQFESLVIQARMAKQRIESSVPRSIGLPREVAYRVLDAVDMPPRAMATLRSDPTAVLAKLQDEVARMRIRECVRFRMKGNPALRHKDLAPYQDPEDAALCSGYLLDQATLNSCLERGPCMPAFSPVAWASVASQLTADWQDMAQSSLLPRLPSSYEQITTAIRACNSKAAVDGGSADEQKDVLSSCLLESKLGPDVKKAYDCVKGLKPAEVTRAEFECAYPGEVPESVTKAMDCAAKAGSREQLSCAAEATLPKEGRDIVECGQESGTDGSKMAICVAKKAGGDVGKVAACAQTYGDAAGSASRDGDLALCLSKDVGGEVGAVAACVQQAAGDWQKAAVCYGSRALTADQQRVIECAQKPTTEAAALCMANGVIQIPEQLRKPVQCLAESGGDPLGAGVCMASDGLTPEQRIALECAVSSGGVPVAFAVCTGGQLTMKEGFNCIDKKLFEGNCMGENNEIRKFFAAIGVDLSPTTVVGQVLNAPVDVLKWQISMAQTLASGLDDFSRNAVKNFADFSGKVAEGGTQLLKGALNEGGKLAKPVVEGLDHLRGEVNKVGDKAIKEVGNGVAAVGGGLDHGAREVGKVFGVHW